VHPTPGSILDQRYGTLGTRGVSVTLLCLSRKRQRKQSQHTAYVKVEFGEGGVRDGDKNKRQVRTENHCIVTPGNHDTQSSAP
jgi:hypothetical protein